MSPPTPADNLPNESSNSMSHLLEDWNANESQIAQKITVELFPQLQRFAQRVLGRYSGASTEAEDVVQSAMKSLCLFMRRQSDGRDVNREDIWKLLFHIAARKAHRRRERQTKGLRGGHIVPLSDFTDSENRNQIEESLHEMPVHEFDSIISEAVNNLNQSLQPIALMVMEGKSQTEIAQVLNCSRRTVIRKFDLIKQFLRSAR